MIIMFTKTQINRKSKMRRRPHLIAHKRDRSGGGAALGETSLPTTPRTDPLKSANNDSDGASVSSSSSSSRENYVVSEHDKVESSAICRPHQPSNSIITLNVGGTIFTTYAASLCSEPSLLALDVAEGFANTLWIDGHPYYDRDPSNFTHILNYFRGYPLLLSADEAMQLAQDAVYFDIKGLRRATGVDASEIDWTFQPGPGVSSTGTSFKSSEMVTLLGAGPLIPGETAVVFLRIEKMNQMAVGIAPTDIPLDAHFGKLPGTIALDSMGEVSCRMLSKPLPGLVPESMIDSINRMLSYDADVILQQGTTSRNPITGAAAGSSPTLLAVGTSPGRQTPGRPPAPTLSRAATATQLLPYSINHEGQQGSNSVIPNGSGLPAPSPLQGPFDQLFLQPIVGGDTSRQPSIVPPMPSPLMPRLPSPPSVVDTPQHLPMGDCGLETEGAQQKYAGFQMIPMLSSNIVPLTSAVPRAREGDELCVVAHLSEDGTVVVVRFYRQQQLMHVVIGLGKEASSSIGVSDVTPASGANSNKKGRRVGDVEAKVPTFGAYYCRQPLPPIQLALYARSGAIIHTSDVKFAPRVSSRSTNQTPFTPPLRPAELSAPPIPPTNNPPANSPLTYAVTPVSATAGSNGANSPTTFTIITSALDLHLQQQEQLRQRQQPTLGQSIVEGYMHSPRDPNNSSTGTLPPIGPDSVAPSTAVIRTFRPGTPPPEPTLPAPTVQQQNAHFRQLRLFIAIAPNLSADLAALVTPQQGTLLGSIVPTSAEIHARLVEFSLEVFGQLESILPLQTLNGVIEYLLALPRFYAMTADVSSILTSAIVPLSNDEESLSPEWLRVRSHFQSIIVAGVRARAIADTTITGMARRQAANAIYNFEGLETKRRAIFEAAQTLVANIPRDRQETLTQLLLLYLPDPIPLWNPITNSSPGQPLPPNLERTPTPRSATRPQITFSTQVSPSTTGRSVPLGANTSPNQPRVYPQGFQSARDLLHQQQQQRRRSGSGR